VISNDAQNFSLIIEERKGSELLDAITKQRANPFKIKKNNRISVGTDNSGV